MKKSRGRPRKFDEADVKKAIMECFWKKGFSSTSLDELAEATGLTRPSLYGAFGDKVNMYLQSMHVYTDALGEKTAALLHNSKSLSEALEGFFNVILDHYFSADHALGCFLLGTAMSEAPSHPEIQELLKDKLIQIEKRFYHIIEKFTPEVTQKAHIFAAQQATATLHFLALRARAGFEKNELELHMQLTVGHIVQTLKLATKKV